MICFFPLNKSDFKHSLSLNKKQIKAIKDLINKIESGEYKFKRNTCLCNHDEEFIVLTKKDRYGIPMENLLCKNCGVIRSKFVMDSDTTAKFYTCDYRSIYSGSEKTIEDFFNNQELIGQRFYNLLNKLNVLEEIKSVFEVGCGAGGILHVFQKNYFETSGCDFDNEYLDFGGTKNLKLYNGEINKKNTKKESQDLIILSHVLEHLVDPLNEIKKIVEFIKPGKYLLIEVPGVLSISKSYKTPDLYFQNAHVYNFSLSHLKDLFNSIGLKLIYGNEYSTLLLQKTHENNFKKLEKPIQGSKANYLKIYWYLVATIFLSKFKLNEWYFHRFYQIIKKSIKFNKVKM